MALGGALGLGLGARDAVAFCVACVAQTHIYRRFVVVVVVAVFLVVEGSKLLFPGELPLCLAGVGGYIVVVYIYIVFIVIQVVIYIYLYSYIYIYICRVT